MIRQILLRANLGVDDFRRMLALSGGFQQAQPRHNPTPQGRPAPQGPVRDPFGPGSPFSEFFKKQGFKDFNVDEELYKAQEQARRRAQAEEDFRRQRQAEAAEAVRRARQDHGDRDPTGGPNSKHPGYGYRSKWTGPRDTEGKPVRPAPFHGFVEEEDLANVIMSFGPHSGKTLGEILSDHPEYLASVLAVRPAGMTDWLQEKIKEFISKK